MSHAIKVICQIALRIIDITVSVEEKTTGLDVKRLLRPSILGYLDNSVHDKVPLVSRMKLFVSKRKTCHQEIQDTDIVLDVPKETSWVYRMRPRSVAAQRTWNAQASRRVQEKKVRNLLQGLLRHRNVLQNVLVFLVPRRPTTLWCILRSFSSVFYTLVDRVLVSHNLQSPWFWITHDLLRALFVQRGLVQAESILTLAKHSIPDEIRRLFGLTCGNAACLRHLECWADISDVEVRAASGGVLLQCASCRVWTCRCLFCASYCTPGSQPGLWVACLRAHHHRHPPVCCGDVQAQYRQCWFCGEPFALLEHLLRHLVWHWHIEELQIVLDDDADDDPKPGPSDVVVMGSRISGPVGISEGGIVRLLDGGVLSSTGQEVGVPQDDEIDDIGGGEEIEMEDDDDHGDESHAEFLRSQFQPSLQDQAIDVRELQQRRGSAQQADVFKSYYEAYISHGHVTEKLPEGVIIKPMDLKVSALEEEGIACLDALVSGATQLALCGGGIRTTSNSLAKFDGPEESRIGHTFYKTLRSGQYKDIRDSLEGHLDPVAARALPGSHTTLQTRIRTSVKGFPLSKIKEISKKRKEETLKAGEAVDGSVLPVAGLIPPQLPQYRRKRRRRKRPPQEEEGEEGEAVRDSDAEEAPPRVVPVVLPLEDDTEEKLCDYRSTLYPPLPIVVAAEYSVSHHHAKQKSRRVKKETHEIWFLRLEELLYRLLRDRLFVSQVRFLPSKRTFRKSFLDSPLFRELFQKNLLAGFLTLCFLVYTDGTQPFAFRSRSMSNAFFFCLNLENQDLVAELGRHITSYAETCVGCQRTWLQQLVDAFVRCYQVATPWNIDGKSVYLRIRICLLVYEADGKERLYLGHSYSLSNKGPGYDCHVHLHSKYDHVTDTPLRKTADGYKAAWVAGQDIIRDQTKTVSDRISKLRKEVESRTGFKFIKKLKIGRSAAETYFRPYNRLLDLEQRGFHVFGLGIPTAPDHTMVLRLVGHDLEVFFKLLTPTIRKYASDQLALYRESPGAISKLPLPQSLFSLSTYHHDSLLAIVRLFPFLFDVIPDMRCSTDRDLARKTLYEMVSLRSVFVSVERRSILASREFNLIRSSHGEYQALLLSVCDEGEVMHDAATYPTRHWEADYIAQLDRLGKILRDMDLECLHKAPKAFAKKSNMHSIHRDAVIGCREREELAIQYPYFSELQRLKQELPWVFGFRWSFRPASSGAAFAAAISYVRARSSRLAVCLPEYCRCEEQGGCTCEKPELKIVACDRVKKFRHTLKFRPNDTVVVDSVPGRVSGVQESFGRLDAVVLCSTGKFGAVGSGMWACVEEFDLAPEAALTALTTEHRLVAIVKFRTGRYVLVPMDAVHRAWPVPPSVQYDGLRPGKRNVCRFLVYLRDRK